MNVKNKFLYLVVLTVLAATLLQGRRLPSAGLVTYRGVGSGDINATFNASAP